MSSNDSTRPEDEGRTVATDADRSGRSTADRDAGTERSTPAADAGRPAEDANGRPAPAPRAADAETVVDPGSTASPSPGSPASPSPGSPASPSPGVSAPSAEAGSAPAGGAGSAATEVPSSGGSTGPGEGPPPWRRVPGEQPAPVEEEPARPTVADSLLSEAPTAFLAAPRASSGTAPERTAGGTATAVQDPVEDARADGAGARSSSRNRPPRQALLQLKRLDPWSVLKMALALAVVLFLVWMVAAGVLYGVLGGMGVWDRLNGTYADLVTGQAEQGGSLISAGRVFALAAVVGFINSLLFAVAMTIGAFVYNVAADLVGGIEVTLSERD